MGRRLEYKMFALLLAGLGAASCAAPARFALRPPVLRDTDDPPLARAPAGGRARGGSGACWDRTSDQTVMSRPL